MEKQNSQTEQAISSNGMLSAVLSEQEHWQSVWTTCRCGQNVQLKKNSMRWNVSNCQCGIQIRQHNGTMIIEPINDVNRNCG